MRTRMVLLVALFGLGAGARYLLPLGHSQGPSPPPPAPGPIQPATYTTPPVRPETKAGPRDLARMSPLQRQMFLSAQRGAEWLHGANRADGRFVQGYLTALKTSLGGDHYLRQAGAAFALARAARFTGEDCYAAVARQAVLTLLVDTAVDPRDANVRTPTLPPLMANRLAAAAMLVLAINELPNPQEDLLKQSEQLCAFIRKQQQSDSSLSCADADDPKAALTSPEAVNEYPGMALYALMLSQGQRPAEWKTEAVRKALAYYRPWWRANKNPAFVPWQTAAYTEAYLRTRDREFAEFVNEMNDWLCPLQYTQLDPRHPLWIGGFMDWADGKPVTVEPLATSACYAGSLAEACRVARQAGDVARYQRYREALERTLQFVTTLQFLDANTQHFADWYRRLLLGAFHASHEDGNLRIDYTQHAVCALVQYLNHAAE